MTSKKRPAAAGAANGPGIIKQLRSPSDTPPPPKPQDGAESDYAFFVRCRGTNERFRFVFENEYSPSPDVLAPGRHAVVRITIQRDANGQPMRRARRRLCFVEGGHA